MPTIKYGKGKTKFGPGVEIKLSKDELAHAIDIYLTAKDIYVRGSRTISYNGKLLNNSCEVYVDPSGFVVHDGNGYDGRGEDEAKRHPRCTLCGHYASCVSCSHVSTHE